VICPEKAGVAHAVGLKGGYGEAILGDGHVSGGGCELMQNAIEIAALSHEVNEDFAAHTSLRKKSLTG
jgi:hypothetical protein